MGRKTILSLILFTLILMFFTRSISSFYNVKIMNQAKFYTVDIS